jgi:hypothetical protein
VNEAVGVRKERGGLGLVDHLDALRAADLKEVYAFWSGGEAPELPKRELVRQLADLIADETAVYRRVRTLTKKVVDVLLRILRRADYRSDLPGLFRRLPNEDQAALEYHEAEAGLKALARRGFLAETADRSFAGNGRTLYAVPTELGDVLVALFREETRTAHGVFSLAGHLAALTANERAAARARFPALPAAAGPDDVAAVLSRGGGAGRVDAIEPPALRDLAKEVLAAGGLLLRADWAGRAAASALPWDRKAWAKSLEDAGAGTVARLSLADYGIACDDEALVLFAEVVEDALRAEAPVEPEADEVLRAGGDLVADLGSFLAQVKRTPVRLTREGDVHRAGRRRIEDGFVFRETCLAGGPEVWAEIRAAGDRLGLVTTDAEGFLAWREEADRWVALSLDEKVEGLYRMALEQPGPRGRSLHLHELRDVVEGLLKAEPARWWQGRSLSVVARQRYLAAMDERKIRERHRDRFFSAYVSGRESLGDLLEDLHRSWIRTLYVYGLLDVAVKGGRVLAVRLSTLGARLLGVAGAAPGNGPATAGRPILATPDFEVVVLPEGDTADAVHMLDGFAQRVRTGDVVHFRLTKESVEAAVADGRRVEDLLAFLEARSRSPVPRNVAFSLKEWSAGVSFATLERGVVLRVEKPEALDRVLAVAGVRALLVRRISPTEALLKEEPTDRKCLADLRAEGVYLRGP